MIVVIPAYEPDEKLLRLVDELKQQTDYKIIIVDDGSKNAESKNVFSKLEADSAVTLLHHKVNRGKGRAMKTAFEYIKDAGFSDDGACSRQQTFFRQGTAPQQIRQRCNTRRVCNFNGRSRLRHADGASCVFNRKA